MFAITGGKGFQISFPNGLTLSTQFGGGNYCSHYNDSIGLEHLQDYLSSKDVEIAVFTGEERIEHWLTKQAYKGTFNEELNDDVKGYVKLEEWLEILNWCQKYKPEDKAEETKKDE